MTENAAPPWASSPTVTNATIKTPIPDQSSAGESLTKMARAETIKAAANIFGQT